MKSWCVLAFLLLDFFCHGTLSCPAFCKCYAGRAEVVCNGAPLKEYPSEGLPENTTMLTIQFTNISTISEQHLEATPQLQELHLHENHLQTLPSNFLRGVPRLHTLDLTGNKLSDLPVDVFTHASLRSLVLKNNLIKEADAAWFPDNSSLTWLDLSGNHLTKIQAAFLQKLPHLETLDLSKNRLEEIPADSLEPLTKLERLNLQYNNLSTLDASVFQRLHKLHFLFLAWNKLNKVPPNLFKELTQLRHLNLEDNRLNHIPTGLLDPLNSLEEDGLDLSVNPLVCDGKAEYLWRWLQNNKKKVFQADAITCKLPPSLEGRSVTSLAESDLNPQS
ncbi:leucine-rich alpha-2-glycoprotein-like [Cololabis saira]|uniref:leucine-rich alpha-2-glycoprotein-like n=1 Tax=Cololabis saira TaxID=129043 RepID=UPI002AD2EED0|nr:leucine-rich alpha-2-glycoprotein-like [Cololabis saira]